jgi:hypothetical protein
LEGKKKALDAEERDVDALLEQHSGSVPLALRLLRVRG